MMKIVYLTTATLNHYYIIKELTTHFPSWDFSLIREEPKRFQQFKKFRKNGARFLRQGRIIDLIFYFPFFDLDPFGHIENRYSKKIFSKTEVPDLYTAIIPDVNDSLAVIRNRKPDLIIVAGTGKISGDVIRNAGCPLINIHDAILPFYRGVNCIPWIIYNNDFSRLGASIHYINERLDEGDILMTRQFVLNRNTRIWQIRGGITQMISAMLIELLEKWNSNRTRTIKNRVEQGRYFSYVPLLVYLKASLILSAYCRYLR